VLISIKPYTKENNYEKKMKGIPVFKQGYSYSCNLTAIAVLRKFLGSDVDEAAITKILKLEERRKGMLPHEFLYYANEAFSDTPYSIIQKNIWNRDEIIDEIIISLELNLPITMYYSTVNEWNKPNFDTHYSVIYGISTPRRIIFISNSYGYLQELSFEDFFNGLAYLNYKKEPFFHQLARFLKIIRPNNLFFLHPKNSF